MPKSLAQGHKRVAILTAAPANPALPTVAELNGGIGTTTGVSCNILESDFLFSATDSDKVQEKALCDINNANALAASNYQAGMTAFRYYDASTGVIASAEDILWTASKVKGTNLYIYVRNSGKLSTQAFAIGDELYMGALCLTDVPQTPSDVGGYIKQRIPLEVQKAWDNIIIAA